MTSNDHRHEFMGSAANERSVIHRRSVFVGLLLLFQINTFVYNQYMRVYTCVCVCTPHCEKIEQNVTHTYSLILAKAVFFNQDIFWGVFFTQGIIGALVILY